MEIHPGAVTIVEIALIQRNYNSGLAGKRNLKLRRFIRKFNSFKFCWNLCEYHLGYLGAQFPRGTSSPYESWVELNLSRKKRRLKSCSKFRGNADWSRCLVVKASGWPSFDRQFGPYPRAIKAAPLLCGLDAVPNFDGRIHQWMEFWPPSLERHDMICFPVVLVVVF